MIIIVIIIIIIIINYLNYNKLLQLLFVRLFYEDKLINGVTEADRAPLVVSAIAVVCCLFLSFLLFLLLLTKSWRRYLFLFP